MDVALSILAGLGLSAACGFRVFVPIFAASLASMVGLYTPSPDFAWMASPVAVFAFGSATLFEIAAYYIPYVDHLFDIVATPAAVLAGILIAAAEFGEMNPLLKWTLATIAGGSIAGAIQLGTVALRGLSLGSTAGATNFIVSTLEIFGAVLMSALAILLPVVGVAAIVFLLAASLWTISRRRKLPPPKPSQQ
ncbi:MAG: hypothetical protein HY22_09605 [[Candidatus Thermochlorobacteriaceae] bacterium GBChlB]|nr:MAG: hypothetical protein HY22_09605 [[Candidatus Thermochlorobacteriaceae] bacterium GBChlB]